MAERTGSSCYFKQLNQHWREMDDRMQWTVLSLSR